MSIGMRKFTGPREVALAVALAVFTRFLDMVLNPSRIDDND